MRTAVVPFEPTPITFVEHDSLRRRGLGFRWHWLPHLLTQLIQCPRSLFFGIDDREDVLDGRNSLVKSREGSPWLTVKACQAEVVDTPAAGDRRSS
jgi:hypothetical protein